MAKPPAKNKGKASETPTLQSARGSVRFAYAHRKIFSDYGGQCLRQRRSSDTNQADIGFSANGEKDFAAAATHVGAGSGWLVTWYDQSGRGNNATGPGQVNSSTASVTNTGGLAQSYCTHFYSPGNGGGKTTVPAGAFTGLTQATLIVVFFTEGNNEGWGRFSDLSGVVNSAGETNSPLAADGKAYESFLSGSTLSEMGTYNTGQPNYSPGANGFRIHRLTHFGTALTLHRNGQFVGRATGLTFDDSPVSRWFGMNNSLTGTYTIEAIMFDRALDDWEAAAYEAEIDNWYSRVGWMAGNVRQRQQSVLQPSALFSGSDPMVSRANSFYRALFIEDGAGGVPVQSSNGVRRIFSTNRLRG